MKKVILIFTLIALSISFTDCNKISKTSQAPATAEDIYCVWVVNSDNVKVFYECVETKEKMESESIRLRNANMFPSSTRKATCSECQ